MSSDSLQKATQTQIKNLESQTGKSLADWIQLVKKSPLSKHGELVNYLKTEFGLGHGNANLVVHEANQSHAAADSETDWIEEQYKGRENWRPFYESLVSWVKTLGEDVELSPKKTYLSLRRKKQFALLQPSTPKRFDIGLALKGVEAAGLLEPSGSWNAMCSHRIRVEKHELTPEIKEWIRKAYETAG